MGSQIPLEIPLSGISSINIICFAIMPIKHPKQSLAHSKYSNLSFPAFEGNHSAHCSCNAPEQTSRDLRVGRRPFGPHWPHKGGSSAILAQEPHSAPDQGGALGMILAALGSSAPDHLRSQQACKAAVNCILVLITDK